MENEEREQLIADLYAVKLAAGLSRGDKEIINRAINYILKGGDVNGKENSNNIIDGDSIHITSLS